MNQDPASNPSASSAAEIPADQISRRAYELWEQDGKPDGNDLRHWLQAEQELRGNQSGSASTPSAYTDSPQARPAARSDSRPLQGTRSAPPSTNRDGKRSSSSPFTPEKTGTNGGTATAGGRRR
jgi:hypothetical protein